MRLRVVLWRTRSSDTTAAGQSSLSVTKRNLLATRLEHQVCSRSVVGDDSNQQRVTHPGGMYQRRAVVLYGCRRLTAL